MIRPQAVFILLIAPHCAFSQATDPAYAPLQKGFDSLRDKHYDQAIENFRLAASLAPGRASIRKDLAYALLKVGETEAARDQFAEALRIDASDQHVALEYAFLCYETRQQPQARRIFDRLRKQGNATAEQAFQNIDRPLAEGIARWSKVLESDPSNFSAHHELAQLAEQRDELALAAVNFEEAWRLRPAERPLLLDLGRVWKGLGRKEQAFSALLAASRGAQPRVAEAARELLPARYPYVYEFETALELDPKNFELRRELAYLFMEMGKRVEAEQQFKILNQTSPDDFLSAAQLGFLRLSRHDLAGAQPLLERVLKGDDEELADRVRLALKLPPALKHRPESPRTEARNEAKVLGEKSFALGYLKDALKYLTLAHENDPVDFAVMLKLGWANNMLHQDSEAREWFKLAKQSPDDTIRSEAAKAFRNLSTSESRIRTTAWAFPFFSTRWHDVFSYAQVKTDFKIGSLPFRPYISTRFVGDLRGATSSPIANTAPQYLSESSFIFGAGISTDSWHGVTLWGEAGEAVKYLSSRKDVGAMVPDYRGGLSFGRGWGHLPQRGTGVFLETNDDAVFVSRFGNDVLAYSQDRLGYNLNFAQLYWNANVTIDSQHQYWANFVETGPGVRFHVQNMPKAMLFSVNLLRGAYLVNEGNPRRPNFFDVRAGFWYAFTH